MIITPKYNSKELQILSEKFNFNLLNLNIVNDIEHLKTELNLIERKHSLISGLQDQIEELEDKIFDLAFATTNVLEKKEEMELLATKDGLTHLYNHSFFKEKLFKQFIKSKETNSKFSIAILDLDHFKNVNDRHGHLAGDKVLKTFAHIIANNVRTIDIPARYGGEEFAIIFAEANHKICNEVIDRIRIIFNETIFEACDKKFQVTFSAGITQFSPNFSDINNMIKIADEALYNCKNSGRNCSKINLL